MGQVLGVNELLYDWQHGHAPPPVSESIYWAAFDGVDDFIDVPDHDDHNFGDGTDDEPFSLSAWVVFTNPGASQQAIMGKYNANTDSREHLPLNNNGSLQFNIYDQNTTNRIQTKTNSLFVDGTIYNVTVTYDGSADESGMNIYVIAIGFTVKDENRITSPSSRRWLRGHAQHQC